MSKCEQCGEEVLFPFKCNYCGKIFCSEHRLPENHQCPNLPKEPPDFVTSKIIEERTTRVGICPKCHSPSSKMIDYDAKTMTFECEECGYKWIQMKSFPHDIIELKDGLETREKPKQPELKEKTRKALGGVLTGCALFFLGLGIIIWEIYNPLFWTIIFVWFIPIPLVFIGGFLVILGVVITASSITTFISSLPRIGKILTILLAALVLGAFVWNAPSMLSAFQKKLGLQPSPTYGYEELVDYALSIINSDRSRNGLSNVTLSSIDSGQQHANNMLKHHFLSHWDTKGYKPYMRYTLAGGKGSIEENIAWYYSSVPFDIKDAIRDLEWQMIHNDSDWDWGHRDNILNPFHNKVSIGIAFDNNNVYFVQDFENDYIEWSTFNVSKNGEVIMIGIFQRSDLSAEWINIFYDSSPSSLAREQLEQPLFSGSYDMGSFVGMAVPSGYESSEGIAITAPAWIQTGNTFQITFNLSPAFNSHGKGVYTLYLQPDSSTTEDSLTSYSFWYSE